MTPATTHTLVAEAAALGVALDGAACDRFARYLVLLTSWNRAINLTRIIDERDVVAKHFLDSLAVVPHLVGRSVVDVGAGPGFPGVPIAIATGRAVTLVESTQKKCAFLEALRRELRLELTVECRRLEAFTGEFDVAVSRATLAPPEWLRLGARLVASGGRLIAMLGKERPPLEAPPGFSEVQITGYTLPLEADRALALTDRVG